MKVNFSDSADRIYQKAMSKGKCAVFVVKGEIKVMGIDSVSYEKTLRQAATRLLGIYTKSVEIDWVIDDLMWAEKHFNGA